ncbi:tryptophanyl-tRNA synthetase [Plasticicumulans lactativorans]|uniref:Tryptophan--tRNA ligase n=1 Tax=Plasticicumulans lactativorans TaxID=1133106 RepID=A0A4R2LJT7_9GAMM|nr:tryptophan--tRNA ligase [Plasticicumulans lactativorans]TCO83496.1 tryptophanyl-tRNA synthetase [Plasticicumulans lactativorans]
MSTQTRILTGITTTGTPHLGNYAGAIRPAIEASRSGDAEYFFFLADYHALVKCQEPERVMQSRLEVAATWLALGLDPERVTFYRQSDVPEIPELTWLLSCVTAKGLMNRAHAYKAAVQENLDAGDADPDRGVTMGLFGYPVLMAADILIFNAHKVPVGRDQIQHLEMTRDIAQRFNYLYGEHFVLPEVVVDEATAILQGLDGRKMSKSYNNTIPLFVPEKELRKLIMRIVTNSQPPGEPKDPDGSTLFQIYRAFATPEESAAMRVRYAEGIGWGEMKQVLFERLNGVLAGPREHYQALLADPEGLERILLEGADKARAIATPFLARLRAAVGLRRLA